MTLSVRALRPWAFLSVLLLSLIAKPLAAQETGKIQGRVTDAASGQPIAGAQVVIVGSRLGNITNADGFYFINNVPAGLQDIQAQYIGYQTVTVRQQRVLAGQTLTQNFQLQQSAVEVVGIEVIGETRPLVPRDQVASKAIVTGETVNDLPVDNVTQIITLQPGVVGGVGKGFSIRGGRSGEEAVFVDGVLVRNFNTGSSSLTIGTNSVSEVDVLTGGFSAEFGEAQSGIINFVTRSGGSRWTGSAAIETDDILPKELGVGRNRAELSFGGPLMKNFGFFFAGTATGQRSSDLGMMWKDVPIFVAQGVDTTINIDASTKGACTATTLNCNEVIIPNFVRYDEGGRIPFSNSDEYTLDSKIDFTYGSGSRVFITGKASRNQARSDFGGTLGDLFNPSGYSGARAKSYTGILGWTHNVVRSAEQALALDFKLAYSVDTRTSGILKSEFDIENRDPAFGFTIPDFQFVVEESDFAVDKALVDRILRNGDNLAPFDVTRTDLASRREYRMNPYAMSGTYNTGGLGGTFNYYKENELQLRGAVDWQVNRQNRLKFGGDYTWLDVANASIAYQGVSFGNVFVESPKRSSLFVQDRLDVGDMVVEAGLRYDRFDPNSDFPVIAGHFLPDDPSTFKRAPVRSSLSPRLGVSFPVTVNSTFRLSYGHFTQLPDFNEYYRGKNTNLFKFANTNTNDWFARPLDMGKTVAFEFGYRQLIGTGTVLDISAYNRDKLRDVAVRKLAWDDPTNPGAVKYLNTFTNADFGNTRGVDVRLDRRFGQIFDAMLGYSYQDSRNTGSDPFTFTTIFARLESNANTILGLPTNPAQAIRVTDENRKHNLTGNFSFRFPNNYSTPLLRNFGLFGTARLLSGRAYTAAKTDGNIHTFTQFNEAELRDDDINTAVSPWIKTFSLRATKGVKVMNWNTNVYVDARNLFNFENRSNLFLTTGDIVDEAVNEKFIESQRNTLGNGTIQNNINLTSRATAGGGVTSDVDLYLLQQAEARFGNADKQFSADEQERVFRQAVLMSAGPQYFVDPGRRIRIGLEITF